MLRSAADPTRARKSRRSAHATPLRLPHRLARAGMSPHLSQLCARCVARVLARVNTQDRTISADAEDLRDCRLRDRSVLYVAATRYLRRQRVGEIHAVSAIYALRRLVEQSYGQAEVPVEPLRPWLGHPWPPGPKGCTRAAGEFVPHGPQGRISGISPD